MIKEIKTYPSHYLALVLILIFGTLAIFLFRFQSSLKLITVYSLALFYVLWGYFHHQQADHVRFKVMLEYFLVALLGILIINSIL